MAGSATILTPSTSDQAFPLGYYRGVVGDGKVLGDADLVAGNIKADVVIFGVTGTLAGAPTSMEGWTICVDDSGSTTLKVYYNKIGKYYHLSASVSGFSTHLYAWSGTYNEVCTRIGITAAAYTQSYNNCPSGQVSYYYSGGWTNLNTAVKDFIGIIAS